MLVVNFILLVSIFLIGSTIVRAHVNTLLKQSVPIELSQLRQFDSNFVHHVEAFSAIETGQDRFEISEKHQNTDGWNFTNYKDLSSRAFTSTNTTYHFLDNDKALYFNMNSKISDQSAMNHLSANTIGICESGVAEVLSYVQKSTNTASSRTSTEGRISKDVFMIGSGSGEWAKSEKVYEWHAAQLPIGTSSKHIQKKISSFVMLRKIEGLHSIQNIESIDHEGRSSTKSCAIFHSVDIHYFELFQNVKIESYIESPFQTSYEKIENSTNNQKESKDMKDITTNDHKNIRENNTKKQQMKVQQQQQQDNDSRKLAVIGITPDNPLHVCSDVSSWGTGYSYYSGVSNSDGIGSPVDLTISGYPAQYTYTLGTTLGCAALEVDLPTGSFNMNYNYVTKNALTTPMSLISDGSVKCDNCYAFLGAGIFVQFEYRSLSLSFYFEAKLQGEAGYNLNFQAKNPSVSGSNDKTLLFPQTQADGSSFSIGSTGLTLSFWFGGMTSTTTGTGSAIGTMSAGKGASYSLMAAVILGPQAFDGKFAFTETIKQPFCESTGLSSNVDVAVTLTPKMNFQLSYGGNLATLGINFYASAPSTTEFIYMKPASSSLSSSPSLSPSPFSSSRRLLIDDEDSSLINNNENSTSSAETYSIEINSDDDKNHHNKAIFYPGENISITYIYSGMSPNEKTVLSYSLISNTRSTELKVLEDSFISNELGSGTFTTNIFLSWNTWFANKNSDGEEEITIIARASTHILMPIIGPTIKVIMYTDIDSAFINAPKNGSIIIAGEPFFIEWNPILLQYFSPMNTNPFGGLLKLPDSVVLNLVEDIYNDNGTMISTSSKLIAGPFNNTGFANITIPLNTFHSGNHFYLTLGSNHYSDVYGWSEGYFSVMNHNDTSNIDKSSDMILTTMTKRTSTKKVLHNVVQTASIDEMGIHTQMIESNNHRKLAICGDNLIPIIYQTQFGGGTSSITFTIATLPITVAIPSQPYLASVRTTTDCLNVVALGGIATSSPTPKPVSDPSTKSSNGSSSAMLGGIIGGVLGLLILILCAFIFCCCNKSCKAIFGYRSPVIATNLDASTV